MPSVFVSYDNTHPIGTGRPAGKKFGRGIEDLCLSKITGLC
jgi:hypothetical protein